jgi:hypothetical protein
MEPIFSIVMKMNAPGMKSSSPFMKSKTEIGQKLGQKLWDNPSENKGDNLPVQCIFL